jgi:formylglycine-generating enzyme required for sulfatase activity
MTMMSICVVAAPIHDAASKDNVAKVKALLRKNPKLLNARDKDQSTPLHYAVSSGKTGVLKLLLSKNALVNLKRNDGATPLHIAVAMKKKDVINMLVRKGAKADLSNMVITFPKGSMVMRNGKKVAGVQRGAVLRVNDVITGGSKGNLDIYVGSVAAVRAKPGTKLHLQKVEKTKDSSEVRIKLEKGSLLTRLRKLTGQSRFILETPGAVAAARGTAYLTSYNNSITNVLVAEGKVGVSLTDTPTQELMVEESQKVEVDKILPATATKVTKLDAGIMKELLSVALPPPPEPKLGEISINPKDGAEMVWVPAGEFIMGSTDEQVTVLINENQGPDYDFNAERPQRRIYLDGYWMYKCEVTVGQYKKYCSETGVLMPELPNYVWVDNYPMIMVSWQDAVDYAKWAGGSLPTAAQWEKAARGTDGRRYPWGNKWDASKCNMKTQGSEKEQPAGSYPAGASPYGCLDMAGNVWEWCSDWWSGTYYADAPTINPTGPKNGTARVLRGGSFGSGVLYDTFRCANRSPHDPAERGGYHGFRCAKNR